MKPRTMSSIAAELGISRTAVSLILKGDGERYRISRATRDRVLELAASVGYRPNWIATALATGRTGVIGLVLPNMHEAFMGELVRGVETATHEAGAVNMIASSMFDPELEYRNLEALVHRGIDALVWAPCASFRGERRRGPGAAALLRESGVKTVCVDRAPESWRGAAILQDDRGAAIAALEALAARGARRPGFVCLDLECSSIDRRLEGWREWRARWGLAGADELLVPLRKRDRRAGDLEAALAALYSLSPERRPDSFLVATNGLSYRVKAVAESLGERPLIAKFGLDPEYWDTGMLGMAQPHFELGRAAAAAAIALAAGGAPSRITLPIPPVEGGKGSSR